MCREEIHHCMWVGHVGITFGVRCCSGEIDAKRARTRSLNPGWGTLWLTGSLLSAQGSDVLFSRSVTSPETAGGFFSCHCGNEGEAQGPGPGGRFWALIHTLLIPSIAQTLDNPACPSAPAPQPVTHLNIIIIIILEYPYPTVYN